MPEPPSACAWRDLATTSEPFTHSPSAACGCCGRVEPAVPLKDVVSTNFTGWDVLSRDASAVCEACAWSFTEPAVRTRPLLIHAGIAQFADWPLIARTLATPVGPDTVAVVPLRGRKHLLPGAEWGTVVTDSGAYTWWDRETRLYCDVEALTEAGVSSEALTGEVMPPSALLIGSHALSLMQAWGRVLEWRGTPQLGVSIHVARRAGKSS